MHGTLIPIEENISAEVVLNSGCGIV